MSTVTHHPVRPVAPAAVAVAAPASAGWRPARLAKLGGLTSAVGLALLALAAVLAPKSDAETLEYAVESIAGSPRPQILVLAASLGSIALVVGIVMALCAGLWGAMRSGRPVA